MALGLWNTQWRCIVSVKTADGVHSSHMTICWICFTKKQLSHERYSLKIFHLAYFSSAHKKFLVLLCAYGKGNNTPQSVFVCVCVCAKASVKLQTRACHFPVWAVALLCIVWEEQSFCTWKLYSISILFPSISLPQRLADSQACQ